MVGKYTQLHDAYLSVVEALKHGGIASRVNVRIRWVDSEEITDENVAEKLAGVDGILVPGGFGPRGTEGMITAIRHAREKKIPFLGICLGMQMLFEKGYEFGETDGLGLIPGSVKLMRPAGELPVPHIGWNSLEKNVPCRLLDRCADGEYVYFVHSYAAECDSKYIAAWCDYGMKVPALVFCGNVYGAQFHPEKSGETGLNILRCFAEL